MAKTSSAYETTLRDTLERLAAYEPQDDVPVVSLYLNLMPNQHGRDHYEPFVRKAFTQHLKAFSESSTARRNLQAALDRINAYLLEEVNRAANGLALFAAAGPVELFEAIQMEAPVQEHWMMIGPAPHLYPLARLLDQYRRYACVLLDTNRARILVFALAKVERREEVTSEKTRRHQMGGWSQAHYQRKADNMHLQHVKEVVEALDRIVREEEISHIIVSGDEVVLPLLREQLPKHLEEKIVDVLSLDTDAPEHTVLQESLEAFRRKDAETDAERVQEVVNAWQAGGLGVVGPEATLRALQLGQVNELLITGSPDALRPAPLPDDAVLGKLTVESSLPSTPEQSRLQLAGELVARAQQTGAHVQFIENPELLKPFGGVAAQLRFRL